LVARSTALGAFIASLSLGASACGTGEDPPRPAPQRVDVEARQTERLRRFEERRADRQRAVAGVVAERNRVLAEVRRISRIRGRSEEAILRARYGSDGTGDPKPWVQSGTRATKAPNSDPKTIAAFVQAQAAGRIKLVNAAKPFEVTRGLIDDRVLRALLALSAGHRLQVSSFRVTHSSRVQDDLGTPATSNHVYGRSADIFAVDGVPCRRETRRARYRTLLDNPPPLNIGPCLQVAYQAARLGGDLELGETIFYWRVPDPSGTSLPNHDDHVHIGYRSYPDTGSERSARAAEDWPDTSPSDHAAPPAAPAGTDDGADLQLPGQVGDSHTLTVPGG